MAGDFDGDDAIELLVPTSARDELVATQRTAGGATVDWRLPLDGTVTSNVTGVTRSDRRVAVGVATDAGVHVWQS